MIKNIYGDYIWTSRLDNKFVEEYKSEFFSQMKEGGKFINIGSWKDCTVKSSFFNTPFVNNCSSIDYNMMFSKKISEEMNSFFTKLNAEYGDKEELNIRVKIQKIWYNEYNYNDFQEPHCHSGINSFYSFVYILKSKDIDTDSKLIFENPRCSHFRSILIGSMMKSIENYKEEYEPVLSEGDLIIFPSHMKHYVKRHENNNDSRISISGNINVL